MFNQSVIVTLLTIATVHFVALMSPGPDFALMLRCSMQQGRKYVLWSALGLAFGVLFHVSYCLLGLSLLLQTFPSIMRSIATAGAVYLLYQGYKAVCFAFKPQNKLFALKPLSTSGHPRQKVLILSAISHGFFTNALNPKAFAYFLSFLLR